MTESYRDQREETCQWVLSNVVKSVEMDSYLVTLRQKGIANFTTKLS